MMRNRIAQLAAAACAGLVVFPAHAGLTCYDSASYSPNFVSAVQETLSKQGFEAGRADGKWGRKTERAVEAYQRSKRLLPTGQINAPTLRALFGPNASAESYGLRPNRSLPSSVFKDECH
jgi:hypothetical protein